MKQQAMNPFLPSYEYIPDGEPQICEGRIYLVLTIVLMALLSV